MKNNAPFAALTTAFTVAGFAVGTSSFALEGKVVAVMFLTFIGGAAAFVCGCKE